MIEIYTDGSCRGNGRETNIGGYGVCVLIPMEHYESGYYLDYFKGKQKYDTTNNRMEMEALIHAIDLAITKYNHEKCIIYCDSAYCVNMCRDWIWTWATNGWKNSKKQIVENIDLVYKLYEKLVENPFPNYTIEKVIGHANILGNEIADALATQDKQKLSKIFEKNDVGMVSNLKVDFS